MTWTANDNIDDNWGSRTSETTYIITCNYKLLIKKGFTTQCKNCPMEKNKLLHRSCVVCCVPSWENSNKGWWNQDVQGNRLPHTVQELPNKKKKLTTMRADHIGHVLGKFSQRATKPGCPGESFTTHSARIAQQKKKKKHRQ